MRVKIEYYYKSEDKDLPFWAKTELEGGKFLCSCSRSWEDVRVKHLQRLAEKFASPEPPMPEEVEV